MKKIVYTQRIEVVESYNEIRDCTDRRIAEFISACGFMPIPLPNISWLAEDYIKEIKPDGIILTGGNSLVRYGGGAPERDDMDKCLIGLSVKNSIPLYGFCRGMQSVLDYFGEQLIDVDGHVAVRQKINGVKDEILGDFCREVNSFHKQACVKIENSDLCVLAKSADGVIKAVKHNKYMLLGTMWHPERENPFNDADIEMVKNFIANGDK